MKKKIWIPIVIVMLLILFVPIPKGPYKDGGTREYAALTYRVVDWNRLTESGTYRKTRVYLGPDVFRPVDALWKEEQAALDPMQAEHTFYARVLELETKSVLVEPLSQGAELRSCDKIRFGYDGKDIGATLGSVVEITYKGGIMETYPAQIQITSWKLTNALQNTPYPGQWLDREQADRPEGYGSADLVIVAIYEDCIIARPIIPMPTHYKLNGEVWSQWCVGDWVAVTFEDIYSDVENNLIEGELVSIEPSSFEPDPDVCYKPVIYLYPQEETEVSVKLALDGQLTCTYPAYRDGWTVTAKPDGTLTDQKGQTYNYLYWEGETQAQWDMTKGFCIKGEDTAAFLEEALPKLGLTRREANEFIVYWLPILQENPYNIISFQTDAYTASAQLEISPRPDALIRVFMVFEASDTYVELPPQELTAPERKGFTAVEWGGAQGN